MAKKEIDKLSVGRLPPKLDKLVSNLIRLDRKYQQEKTLKRLPSVISEAFNKWWKDGHKQKADMGNFITQEIKKKLKEESDE